MQMPRNTISLLVLALLAGATASSGEITAAEPAALKLVEGPGGVTIRAGDRTVLEYRTTPSPMKPYVRELFSPGGVQVVRDAVPDHKHHHGLMFAVGVNGVNFWEETPTAGTEKPRGRLLHVDGFDSSTPPARRFIQTLDWTDAHGKQLLVERREVEAVRSGKAPRRSRWSCGRRNFLRPQASRR